MASSRPGGGTPEGSLSLLFSNYVDAYTLRGKTVPLNVTEEGLETGKLGPDSCGWHYVEGLTDTDDPQIAILWDKVGLGHNGETDKWRRSRSWLPGRRASSYSCLEIARISGGAKATPCATSRARRPCDPLIL
jgi:hypothetical protein